MVSHCQCCEIQAKKMLIVCQRWTQKWKWSKDHFSSRSRCFIQAWDEKTWWHCMQHSLQCTAVKIFLGTTKDAKDLFHDCSPHFPITALLVKIFSPSKTYCTAWVQATANQGQETYCWFLLFAQITCSCIFSLKESCFIDLHFIRSHLSTSSREITNDSPFSAVELFLFFP